MNLNQKAIYKITELKNGIYRFMRILTVDTNLNRIIYEIIQV